MTILDLLTYTHHAVIELTYGERHVIDCSELLESYDIECVEGDRFLEYKTVTPKLYEVNRNDLEKYIMENLHKAIPEEEFEQTNIKEVV